MNSVEREGEISENPFAEPQAGRSKGSTGNGRRFLGCGCAVVGLIALVLMMLIPNIRRARPAAYRTMCKGNLKQIALALHNYADVYGSIPPAYTTDAEGNKLHSWRTLILPYAGHSALYDSIDLSKPWNDPANAAALTTDLPMYRCRSADVDSALTTYMAIVGDNYGFHALHGRKFEDIADHTSNTIWITEVNAELAIPWMQPYDTGAQFFLSLTNESETSHAGGVQVALMDGSVRFVSNKLDQEQRTALLTIDGGEVIADW